MLPMTGYLPQGCRHRDIVGLSRANESSTAKSRKCTRQPITASHLWISAIDDRVGSGAKLRDRATSPLMTAGSKSCRPGGAKLLLGSMHDHTRQRTIR